MSQIFRLCCHEIWKTICSLVVNRSTWSPMKKRSVNLRNNSANISVQLTYFRVSRLNFQSKSYVFSTYAVCTHTCMPALSVRYHWCYIRMLISSKVLCKLPQFSRLLNCRKIILAEWFSSNQLEQVEWKQLKHVAHILAKWTILAGDAYLILLSFFHIGILTATNFVTPQNQSHKITAKQIHTNRDFSPPARNFYLEVAYTLRRLSIRHVRTSRTS